MSNPTRAKLVRAGRAILRLAGMQANVMLTVEPIRRTRS